MTSTAAFKTMAISDSWEQTVYKMTDAHSNDVTLICYTLIGFCSCFTLVVLLGSYTPAANHVHISKS